MNIRIFSFPVFSFQFNLNNTDGVVTNSKTPITIISIDKIINTFIIYYNCTPAPLRNAKSIVVKTNNKIKFNLLYDKNRSLQKKIKI